MIDGHTKLFGFLAHPAVHSLSPLIHNTSFKVTGINGTYLAFDVTSDGLENTITALRSMHIGGVNLSMPLKTEVIPLLDEMTPRAKRLQAVNTIVNQNGKLIGDTTDGQGFVDALAQQGISVAGKQLTVLGAGGAGRSIIAALIDAGARQINVFKRQNETFEKRKQQLESWSDVVSVIPYENLEKMAASIEASQIIVNTTNVGMSHDHALPILQTMIDLLNSQQIVVDVIYFPLTTPFLEAAKKQGCQTFNGVGMLVHQAAGSFLEWTGKQMPVKEVIAAVRQEVMRRQDVVKPVV
ncbi:shikimate dehydrogenase [Lentilactobacillus diolivorans]|uniref:shikimate dehydrogenase n=1 Tax=Lentilactobacillus diolivorans TaxID=179838 RepID=UPI00246916A9|nr:shikimate dehydrogenase [Lentilactobacillus diolivorans]MDH5105106.1 shikimate dehydrogenase [Lentilactobacillus diolivorans]